MIPILLRQGAPRPSSTFQRKRCKKQKSNPKSKSKNFVEREREKRDMSDLTKLDLCFVCDTTGSMSGSIRAVQTHLKKIAETITASEKRDLRLACVEYKDHCDPIVTSFEEFTSNVGKLKRGIDHWKATGGGDHAEAIVDGLQVAKKLDWRNDATKMLVLCADAPPHGVGSGGDYHPNGCPCGLDPLEVVQEMVKKEIIFYTVGVGSPDHHTVSFLCTLSRMTGGRYLPLAQASNLPQILMGGAEEELELAKFEKQMEEEKEQVLKEAEEKKETLTDTDVAQRIASNLARKEVKVQQLQVSTFGGGEAWKAQETEWAKHTNLRDYNRAHGAADYSCMPSSSAAPMMSGGGRGGRGGRGGMGGGMGGPPSSFSFGAAAYAPSPLPSSSSSSSCPAAKPQSVAQVSDYIQTEHVERYMSRAAHSKPQPK